MVFSNRSYGKSVNKNKVSMHEVFCSVFVKFHCIILVLIFYITYVVLIFYLNCKLIASTNVHVLAQLCTKVNNLTLSDCIVYN